MTAANVRALPRQPLHLFIDPYPYRDPGILDMSPGADYDSSSSPVSHGSTNATSPTTSLDPYICSVICMYDFHSDDPDHLPFRKNEILDVVKQEETGWWAAMRKNKDEIGWIPRAFVQPVTDTMAAKLWKTAEEYRVLEYEAEQLYEAAPTYMQHYDPVSALPSPIDIPVPVRNEPKTRLHVNTNNLRSDHGLYRARPPPSPMVPVPQPSSFSVSLYDKPTPPTPQPSQEEIPQPGRGRAGSLPTHIQPGKPSAEDRSRLPALTEFLSSDGVYHVSQGDASGSIDLRSLQKTQSPKWQKVMGVDDTLNDVPSRPPVPWYMQPRYTDQMVLAPDHTVLWGSKEALVEKLTFDAAIRDSAGVAEDALYCNSFLMTFRTFMSPETLFDMIVDRYREDHPKDLNSSLEFDNWRRHNIASQRRALMILTMWLEDHRLLEEEPHIAQRLTAFLKLIITPPLAEDAQRLMDSIERLTFADPAPAPSPVSPRKARKTRPHKNDLLRLDPTDIAEQLALIEFKKYVKITPQECIRYVTVGPLASPNVSAFIATHDRVVDWVKISILSNDSLGKRADTIDTWIKVAEKCKAINNIASMSAILNALSSAVITRLHLTWAHVGRKSALETLLRFSEPAGGFSAYKKLLSTTEGPCIPFIGMYLTDIAHINDTYTDEDTKICFLQRKRWHQVVTTMIRYQSRPYDIFENESTHSFIHRHLYEEPSRDHDWFWARSQDVQHSELAHADIRKGLEAAGF